MVEKKYTFWEEINYYVVKRFLLKSVVPFVISALIAYASGNPNWVALAPVLQLAEKYARDSGYWFNY